MHRILLILVLLVTPGLALPAELEPNISPCVEGTTGSAVNVTLGTTGKQVVIRSVHTRYDGTAGALSDYIQASMPSREYVTVRRVSDDALVWAELLHPVGGARFGGLTGPVSEKLKIRVPGSPGLKVYLCVSSYLHTP